MRRAHVEAAMRRAGVSNVKQVASAMYRSLGRGLVELVQMALGGRVRQVELPPELVQQISSRRGAVIATAHTGNWDLVACAAAERLSLTVATKRLHVGWLNRLWQSARSRRGLQLVEAGAIASAARRIFARGECLAMMIDQAPERSRAVAFAHFLGERAAIDLAPALVAARAKVPIFVLFPLRREDGRHSAELACVIEPPLRASRAWAEASMKEATRLLEAFVLRHPEQWLWMHRRWKDAVPARATELCARPASV